MRKAPFVSDRTVILKQGRVVEAGPIESVFGNSFHAYTQMLMASVPRLDERWAARPGPAALRPEAAAEAAVSKMVEAERNHYVAMAG